MEQTKLFRCRSRTNIEYHVTCVNMGSAGIAVCVTDVVEMISCTAVSAVTSPQSLGSCLFRDAVLPAVVLSGPMMMSEACGSGRSLF